MITTRTTIRRLVATLAVAPAIGAAVIGLAPAAGAAPTGPATVLGTCGDTFSPSTSGAKAYWEVQCTSTSVRINGWVEDTEADGQCAKVKASWSSGQTYFSAAACPKGTRKYFTSPYYGGRTVNAYLYEYNN